MTLFIFTVKKLMVTGKEGNELFGPSLMCAVLKQNEAENVIRCIRVQNSLNNQTLYPMERRKPNHRRYNASYRNKRYSELDSLRCSTTLFFSKDTGLAT
jgi:hypothetical protein